MVQRICLILAILAGAGVIAISHFQLRPQIEAIIKARNDFENSWKTELARANKLDKNLKETTAKLVKTEKDLKDTQTQLTAANSKIKEQTDRIATIQKRLDDTQASLNEKSQKLAAWDFLGVTPDQVKAIIDANKKLQIAKAALEEEKTILNRRLIAVTTELNQIKNPEDPVVPLPPLKGKVLVVDPKWNFVVLDVGQTQGALVNGVLMVSRNSKLVAKVKIVTVQPDRCIANILPGWKLTEVMEGDIVIN